MSRFGFRLEFTHWGALLLVGTWLELLRRPILVYPLEATARHQRTWLGLFFTAEELEAFKLMTVRSAAATQQLLPRISAVSVGITAESSSEPSHPNGTTTDNRMSHQWTAAPVNGAHSPTCVPSSDKQAMLPQIAVKK
jgi:hypothetical protein